MNSIKPFSTNYPLENNEYTFNINKKIDKEASALIFFDKELKVKTSSFDNAILTIKPQMESKESDDYCDIPDLDNIFADLIIALKKDPEIYHDIQFEISFNKYSDISFNIYRRFSHIKNNLDNKTLDFDKSYSGIRKALMKRLREEVYPLYKYSYGDLILEVQIEKPVIEKTSDIYIDSWGGMRVAVNPIYKDEQSKPEVIITLSKMFSDYLIEDMEGSIINEVHDYLRFGSKFFNSLRTRDIDWVFRFRNSKSYTFDREQTHYENNFGFQSYLNFPLSKSDSFIRVSYFIDEIVSSTRHINLDDFIETSTYGREYLESFESFVNTLTTSERIYFERSNVLKTFTDYKETLVNYKCYLDSMTSPWGTNSQTLMYKSKTSEEYFIIIKNDYEKRGLNLFNEFSLITENIDDLIEPIIFDDFDLREEFKKYDIIKTY